MATWGEKLVPLGEFRDAAAAAPVGAHRRGASARRARAIWRRAPDPTPVEGPFERIAVFGGVYINHLALAALLERRRPPRRRGDLLPGRPRRLRPQPGEGLAAPRPGRRADCIQGNYEESLSAAAEDCNCGYTDPRDNHFAELSYRYTERHCSDGFKAWMGALPGAGGVRVGERELLLVHGSPRRINEFCSPPPRRCPSSRCCWTRRRCDGMLCTHTGLHWHRRLPSGRDAVNVGVIGRPANDGAHRRLVRDARSAADERRRAGRRRARCPLAYDHRRLAAEMRREELPEEFVETIETGWWTTCLEILPAKERAESRF